MAANREDRREDHRDPPAEDSYSKIELIWEAKSISFTELHYYRFRSAKCAKQQRRRKKLH